MRLGVRERWRMVDDNDLDLLELSFGGVEVSVLAQVRKWLAAKLPDLGQDHRDAVLLVCTELVTNVYEHAPGPFAVRLGHSRTSCRVWVEVRDTSREPPAVGSSAKGKFGGRGMVLVDKLADSWGVDRTEDGKTVWVCVTCGEPETDIAHCHGEH